MVAFRSSSNKSRRAKPSPASAAAGPERMMLISVGGNRPDRHRAVSACQDMRGTGA